MAAINANIVVDTTNLTVTPTTNNLGVVVDPINLNVYSGAFAPAGGNQGELQYNDIGALKGVANTSVANGNITFTNLSNVKIDGGTNAYYLQTDGTGNLTWAAGGTPTGSGVPSGANTQIQLSDGSGSFDSGAGFTFDKSSNIFSTPGRAIFAGNVDSTGGIFNGDGYGLSNIASANIVGLNVSEIANGTSNVNIPVTDGNISMSVNSTVDVVLVKTTGLEVDGTVTASAVTANTGLFTGDGGGLSNVTAAVAQTVTSAAQPNITTVGTLTSLNVAGTTTIQQAKEKMLQEATPASGVVNYNLLDQAIVLQTSDATGNFTLNFRGNAATSLNSVMSVDESMTCTFINQNGATAYLPTIVQVDGNPITVKYSGIGIGAGTPNGNDSFTFNILKTAVSTFSIFGSRVGYL